MNNRLRFLIAAIAGVAVSTSPARAQIAMSAGAYGQNFNSLATTGTGNPWMDNVTLPGWYAAKTAGGTTVTEYRGGPGDSNAGALYSFGVEGVQSINDRALGTIASGTPGDFAFGVRFRNDTGMTQTNIRVSYTGEQWRSGGNVSAQALAFTYRVSSTPITNADAVNASAGWIFSPALTFVTPTVGTTAGALDGNAAANRQGLVDVFLADVSVPAGHELFLRWLDINDLGNDHGIALDDLVVTFDGSPTNPPSPPATTESFSILTYNVRGNGATDWSTNSLQVQAIARQLQHLEPDVVTFNEIPLDYRYEMTNWISAFLPAYKLAVSTGTDGSICSAIISRHPITRSNSWLARVDLRGFGYSNANNNLDNFTRDLFEAELAVPGFPQPLHVFTTHLKATESAGEYADNAAKRAAEATAITNFLATNLINPYPLRPYILTGDLNASDTNELAIQKLISPATGLRLTDPRNPVTDSINTYSTTTANPGSRLDYLLPGQLLFSNIRTGQVFRTDRLSPVPPTLNSNDCKVASDHLPVLLVFDHPYNKPFRLLSITHTQPEVTLAWESVAGQSYQVEASSNLAVWSALASRLATGSVQTLSSNLDTDAQFFRVRRLP